MHVYLCGVILAPKVPIRHTEFIILPARKLSLCGIVVLIDMNTDIYEFDSLVYNIIRFFFICLCWRQIPYKAWWLQNNLGIKWDNGFKWDRLLRNTIASFRERFLMISFSVFITRNKGISYNFSLVLIQWHVFSLFIV